MNGCAFKKNGNIVLTFVVIYLYLQLFIQFSQACNMSRQQPSVSSFPSMAAFMGGNPSKRPRIQEPPQKTSISNMT